jgi:hypothetical protein
MRSALPASLQALLDGRLAPLSMATAIHVLFQFRPPNMLKRNLAHIDCLGSLCPWLTMKAAASDSRDKASRIGGGGLRKRLRALQATGLSLLATWLCSDVLAVFMPASVWRSRSLRVGARSWT